MLGHKCQPRYDQYNLADEFARALVHGEQAPLRAFSPTELQPSPDRDTFMDKSRGKVFMQRRGLAQIIYVIDVPSGNNSAQFVYVHNVGLVSGKFEELSGALGKRIGSLLDFRGKRYDQIFDMPQVHLDEVEFNGVPHKGLSTHAQLIELPRGPNGRLSGSLVEYVYNVFIWPSFSGMSGELLPRDSDWCRF